MEVKIVNEVIEKACKGRSLSESEYLIIIIKDDKITFSKELESVKDADECMLYLPSYWDNTVKNKYGPGDVTFRNPIHVLRYIDSDGKVQDYYAKNNFSIMNQSVWIDNNTLSLTYYPNSGIVNLIKIGASEEGFIKVWDCYQVANKCLNSQLEDFNKSMSDLEEKLKSVTDKYNKLSLQHEKILNSIKGIIDHSQSESE